MRYILLTFVFIALLATRVAAQTATPSATPPSDKAKQIEDLKERLATKVAELVQTHKSAIHGTVKDVTISTITIETPTKDIKIDLTDELVIFQNIRGKRTKLTSDELAKGDIVTVFGDYDTTLDILSARVVFIQSAPPARTSGLVTAIDREAFTITVTPPQGPAVTVDIEKTTKTVLWDGKSLAKSGFSKIQTGEAVHVVGSLVPKQENRISASRIVDLGNRNGTAAQPTQAPATSPAP